MPKHYLLLFQVILNVWKYIQYSKLRGCLNFRQSLWLGVQTPAEIPKRDFSCTPRVHYLPNYQESCGKNTALSARITYSRLEVFDVVMKKIVSCLYDITCKDNDPELLYNQEYKNEAFIRYGSMVCKGGVVVRALVPHQCRPGLNPGFHALFELS